jgi:hypothetical protein
MVIYLITPKGRRGDGSQMTKIKPSCLVSADKGMSNARIPRAPDPYYRAGDSAAEWVWRTRKE